MDPLSITGVAIAVEQVIAACLKSSRKYVGPSHHSSKDLQEISSDLYSLNAAIANLKTHLEINKEDQVRIEALSKLKEPLEISEQNLNSLRTRLEDATFVKKYLLGVRFDKPLKQCLMSLKLSRTLFHEVLQMDQRAISSATEKYVRKVAEDVTSIQSNLQTLDLRSQQNHQEMRTWQVKAEQQKQDDEDRNILNWLSSLNFMTKQNDILSRRHERTGVWFLNSTEFQKWVAGPARMLWCPGIPGAGKTVLASLAVDHLQTIFKDEKVAVLCVFCSYTNQDNQTSVDLVASILKQVLRTTGVTDEIRKVYQDHQTHATRPGLTKLSSLLQSSIATLPKVFIVIDGLDECPQTTRDTFVREIPKLGSSAHLLITSRQSISIAREFPDAMYLELHASDTDLEVYIRSKTQQDRHLARYVGQDPSLQEEVVATIIGKARGMFLLVQLHLESLARQKNKRDMRKALRSLPKELDETYDQAMERIRSQDTESVRLAERVLAWISNARRPFSVEELQHGLAVQPGENTFDEEAVDADDEIVSVCAGLVTVDRESQIIRLVHHTTQLYFERVRSEITTSSQVDIQIEMAKACITYLGFDEFESDEFTHGKESIEISDELRLRNPFLDYAGKNWGHHARGAPEDVIREMIWGLLYRGSRVSLACQLIDDTLGMWDFGPIPAMTLLIHFGLERILRNSEGFGESQGPKCAIRYRHDTLVFFLVERDADWYDSGHQIIRAECSSFKLEGNETMVELLADKGAMVDLSVDNGELLFIWSLFTYAAAGPSRILLKLGASFDPQNMTFYTPLMGAVIGGDDWDVQVLLVACADVNEKNERGRDALIYAALARHETVVNPLLEAGADVHSRDEDGMTALGAACQSGSENIVKLLLENGADVSAQDKRLRTPISIATESGHAPLLRLLHHPETYGNSEDEVEAKTETEMTGLSSHALQVLYERDRDVGLPGNKLIESVRRGVLKMYGVI